MHAFPACSRKVRVFHGSKSNLAPLFMPVYPTDQLKAVRGLIVSRILRDRVLFPRNLSSLRRQIAQINIATYSC